MKKQKFIHLLFGFILLTFSLHIIIAENDSKQKESPMLSVMADSVSYDKCLRFIKMAADGLPDVDFDNMKFKNMEGEICKSKDIITLSVSGVKGQQIFNIVDTIPFSSSIDGYLAISNEGKTSKITFVGDTLCFISYEEDERIFIFSTK